MRIPESHPRYHSLMTREKLVEGFRKGLVAPEGLIAQGRGECFDYLLGETSHDFALEAERAAVAMLIISRHPVISVNGNTAALVGKEISELAKLLNIPLEVNIFYRTEERFRKIAEELEKYGAVVYSNSDAFLEGLESARRMVDKRGIYRADVVLVPLEDGDRCEILKKHGKKVITIDLNPLSRTAQMADVTIVDNVVRAIPNMTKFAKELMSLEKEEIEGIVRAYDNRNILRRAVIAINEHLSTRAGDFDG
ncbi:4-phosphopantoate--beta-alanine ligase [Geoglobus acetivorans]|uniref:4-phosphopantoate--beta-alanine ligase n=1 Tax=Geoglobus acetivorans TaxID=565033 RepID=A0ABZ3H4G9_GEOAI|nr:phosphopantothenate/pantothenate synthetase [Geoglobus acetivorans]